MIVLIAGVAASLALGVLVAYGVCLALFGLFRIHARQLAAARVEARAAAAATTLGAV